MNDDGAIPTIGTVVAGYLLSAAATAVTSAFIFCAGLPSSGNAFLLFAVIGFACAVVLGLPGFAITIFMSRRRLIRHWAYFTGAGGLNAILAWTLVCGPAFPFMGTGGRLMLASVAGGFVGGFAYWFAVECSGRGRRAIASD